MSPPASHHSGIDSAVRKRQTARNDWPSSRGSARSPARGRKKLDAARCAQIGLRFTAGRPTCDADDCAASWLNHPIGGLTAALRADAQGNPCLWRE